MSDNDQKSTYHAHDRYHDHGNPSPPPYGIIDPDYARIYTKARIIAWQYGFCLAMHGSFTRDLDLIMVSWEKRATAKMVDHVVRYMASTCGLKMDEKPGQKPHGRLAYSLLFDQVADPRWVDLSVIPAPLVDATVGVEPTSSDLQSAA